MESEIWSCVEGLVKLELKYPKPWDETSLMYSRTARMLCNRCGPLTYIETDNLDATSSHTLQDFFAIASENVVHNWGWTRSVPFIIWLDQRLLFLAPACAGAPVDLEAPRHGAGCSHRTSPNDA